MLILVLLPRTMMATSILILQLAKIGTAAVTFMFFLKKISVQKPKTISLIIFPTMYALMSYMVVQLMDPMWLDCVIALPLICWGIDSLIKENRFRLLIGSLVYAFVSNFYIGFMAVTKAITVGDFSMCVSAAGTLYWSLYGIVLSLIHISEPTRPY